MKRPYFLTIQKKFLILILLVGLIPAAAGVAVTIGGSRLSYAWATANGLELRAREIADRIGQDTEQRFQRLGRVVSANDGELLRIRLDSASAESADVLFRYRPGEPLYAVPLHAPDDGLAQLLRRENPDFAGIAALDFPPDGGVVEDLRLEGEAAGGPVGLIVYLYPDPLAPRGGLLGFASRADRALGEIRTTLGQDSVVSVFSRRGYMLTSPPAELDLIPEARGRFDVSVGASTGWFNVTRREGSRNLWFLVAYAPVPRVSRLGAGAVTGASPWVVLLTYDMESFLGPQSRLIWTTAFIAGGWALLLMAVSVVVTRRVVGPVKQLRYQVEAMAAGDLNAQARVRTRDEIQDLASAFNTMARKLRKSYGDLESRVEESRLRANHIYVINEITKAITQALDLDRTFEILKRELPRLLQYDALWIALVDKGTAASGAISGRLHVTHAEPPAMVESLRRGGVPLEHSFHGRALREMKAARGTIGPQDDADPSQSGVFTLLGYKSFLVAPLPSVDRALGTVTVVSRSEGVYGAEEEDILASVASAVAVGIEQAELFRRTREFAEELERKVQERTRELERANQELIQAEKYAATGRLGANLAHEINNPLGIIKNYLRICTDSLKRAGGGRRSTDPNLDHLMIIEEEINRIARIVRQLLDLHRPADDNPQRTDIAALLQDILALMERELERQGIEIECDLEPNMPRPMVAPDLVRQVYINLLRNAQDAMEAGGRLTITARTARLGEGERAQPAVAVAVADTGTGIDTEGMKHIFDPFYTTKSPDKGTGLGLYVSYGIVQRYQGSIEVKSEKGRGTTMTVTLPVDPVHSGAGLILPARFPPAAAAPAAPAPLPGGSPAASSASGD